MAWNEALLGRLDGRYALVTGGASGLGYETAAALARRGASVLVADRNVGGGEDALRRIRAATPGADVSFKPIDLADLGNIRAFSSDLVANERPLDILVNNAGITPPLARRTTADGFELKFGINYLGHFALTGLLLPLLLKSNEPRVVTVSSIAHKQGHIHFDDLQLEKHYDPQRAYNQTKLACLVFALELQRRCDAAHVKLKSVAAHPGVARTALPASRKGQKRERFTDHLVDIILPLTMAFLGQSAEKGARPIIHAAAANDVPAGAFYGPDGFGEMKGDPAPAKASAEALDPAIGKRLWEISTTLTGVAYADLG
ncbi:oxidoreductase [Parvibaculum sp.]|uniref:oxidoreductase n=1 Tax=Parvibaculum sp. TaxID=2024848 RepID=UPI002BE7CE95|nr:oxidoreductase [Parvibaculum sp.]HUD51395.1 oxidoreductase [Parvibaculum sp.]